MAWRIYATAQIGSGAGESHATLYLIPGGGLNLRAQAGAALLLDGFYDTLDDALLGAALHPQLPQPLYEALMDAVARRGPG